MVAPVLQEPDTTEHISLGRQAQSDKIWLPKLDVQALQGKDPKQEPMPESVPLRQHDTCNQWLRWLGEQVSGVVNWMEEEESLQIDRLFATTEVSRVCVTWAGPRGSWTREYEGIKETRCLLYDNTTSRPLPEQGLVAPFVGLVAFIDQDSLSFRDHCTSQVIKRVQAKMSTQDESTRGQ